MAELLRLPSSVIMDLKQIVAGARPHAQLSKANAQAILDRSVEVKPIP